MEQIKLKTFTAETLELLEKNINAFLSSEEATNLKLVNITIKENDICHFKSMTKCSILNLINLLILN
ncbi:TPA: hypothetical protein PQH14_000693 [Staphylococcus aureus]|nr:hypothetical protein [Staphylococcus aureus]